VKERVAIHLYPFRAFRAFMASSRVTFTLYLYENLLRTPKYG
jgi:hypothetical protein